MMRWFVDKALLLLLVLAVAVPAWAQDPDPARADTVTEDTLEDDENLAPRVEDLSGIDQILEGDEEVLAGGGYTYDPGDRRDPFISPFRRQVELPRGPRPEGKAGLLIEELSLTGIFETPKGTLAQVRGGSKDKSYLIQSGDQLYDGDVVSVRLDEVVFKQQVNDPAAIKPFREVVKRLNEKK